MTYAETLDYLYTQLPMYQRQGDVALRKDLGNIRELLAALENPERRMGRIVHVGGTNGKGTTAHLIAAALQGHGCRVGMYTSPHYRDFRERIKIDGTFISERAVVDFVANHRAIIEQIQPSFFEITVAMAFDFFARSRRQSRSIAGGPGFWSVVEVGLGGRLDSTNVVDPTLSVITNIGLDHTDMLGNTPPAIAYEKAGIIKSGRSVVVGERQIETWPLFYGLARDRDAPLTFGDQFDYDFPVDEVFPEAGPHFRKNVQTALTALHALNRNGELVLDRDKLRAAWSRLAELTYFIGRWQTLSPPPHEPLIIADSAHNAEGLGPVVKRLERIAAERSGRLHLVLGVVRDKDLDKILPLFPREAVYYFVAADIPRALAAGALAEAAGRYGLAGQTCSSVAEGLAAAGAAAVARDVVFVGGSIFTVGEALSYV